MMLKCPNMVSGDLSAFPLLPVMQMLLASGRNGQFIVDHPRGGEIWLKSGEIVHASSGELVGEHALQLLSSLDAGTFSFEPDCESSQKTLSLRQDSALHRMLSDQEAWIELLRLFPDWTRPLRFTARWTDQQPVSRLQYQALHLIREGLALRGIVDQSNMSPRTVIEIFKPFLMGGLIEIA